MNKPQNWDNTPAYTGESEQIPLGGHICVIKGAKIETNDYGENLIIAFDIAQEDPSAGFYKRKHDKAKQYRPDAKWPGTMRQGIDGKGLPFFKGMITSIEESNPGYVWSWDEKTLSGKKFGGVFGRRQFETREGELKFCVECVSVRSVDVVKAGVEVPEDRLLRPSKNAHQANVPAGLTEVETYDLPF